MATITNPKTIQAKSRSHQVIDHGASQFTVVSGYSGQAYTVTLQAGGATCTCNWGQYRKASDGCRSGCSHVVAVYDHCERQAGRRASAWASEEAARRQHRPTWSIGDGVHLTSRKAA